MKKEESEMYPLTCFENENAFDSKSPESLFQIALAENLKVVEVDYRDNPHWLLEIEEFRDVIGLPSAIQAGFLINQDESCWITNLGRAGSTEVYRPANKRHRRLDYNQVAYLKRGDFVGFYGAFFQVRFGEGKLRLLPVDFLEQSANPQAS